MSRRKLTKILPSVEYLRECFTYNRRTGELRWRSDRPVDHFSTERERVRWNTRYAGKIAGTYINGYCEIKIFGSKYKAHRIIWKIMTGNEPPKTIDHENGKHADNRWINLREATMLEQNWNARVKRNNTSGYCGVHRVGSGRYGAQIRIDRVYHYLGTFDTPEEASAVREDAARRLHGKFYREGK